MTSTIKVDTIQTAAGGTPTAANLGLNVSGSVLQVKQAIKADRQTISTFLWTDISGLSVTITPTSTTSKILVKLAVNGAGNNNCYVKLASSQSSNMISSIISDAGATSGNRIPALHDYYWGGGGWDGLAVYSALEVLDEPQTTSPITYNAQGITYSGTFYINQSKDGEDSASRAALLSSITLMEIAG